MKELVSREEAVRWPSNLPLKVIAGAGTGKTTFLVERFMHLVEEERIPSDRILGLTFTRKAAQELEERLREHLGMRAEETVFHIHTFDGFWLRLLLAYPVETQLEEPITIVDDGLARILHRRMVREIEQGCPEISLLSFEQMNLLNFPQVVMAAQRVVDSAKLRLIDSTRLSEILRNLRLSAFPDDPNPGLVSETIRFIEGVAHLEERLLTESKALDYGSILLRVYRLLSGHEALRGRIQREFRHILIDEAQDTNFGQFALLKFIAAEGFANVTVVGDTRQSIFGFRDADPRSLQDFQATICSLGENFRSHQAILDLAVEVLRRWKADEFHVLRAKKGDSSGLSVVGFLAPSAQDENRILCELIRRAIEKGIRPKDIAVLARARATLVRLEEMLRAENIPTISLVGGFYQRPEILDARAYLVHLLEPNDRGALSRILERAPEPLSLAEIHGILGTESGKQFVGEVHAAAAVQKHERLLQIREDVLSRDISLPLRWFGYLEKSGYMSWIASLEESERLRAQANLRKLFELAHRLTTPPLGLSDREMLHYLDLAIEAGEDEVEADYGGGEGVVLTTIHRAKGLEFPVVIYCSVHDKVIQRPRGFFAHLRSRHTQGDWRCEGAGLLLPEDFEAGGNAPPDAGYKEDAAGEEKRLDYVALTRAKRLQIVCGHAGQRRKLAHVLQTLEDLAPKSPERFFFSHQPNIEELQELLPLPPSGEEVRHVVSETPRRDVLKRPIMRPTLRWSFSDFEREYIRERRNVEPAPLYSDDESRGDAIERGIILHEAIRLAGFDGDWRRVVKSWNALSLISTDQISRWQNTIRKHLSSHGTIFTETPFEFLLKADEILLWLRGTIDRLEIQGGTGRLIDFKTGRWNEEAASRAERQLNFYALAWHKGLWPEVKTLALSILHLDEERMIPIPLQSDFESIVVETARKSLSCGADLELI
ncbi:MAG: ATP-dependent DNA helicase [bacterium]